MSAPLLTEEEIEAIWIPEAGPDEFARAVEAALLKKLADAIAPWRKIPAYRVGDRDEAFRKSPGKAFGPVPFVDRGNIADLFDEWAKEALQ